MTVTHPRGFRAAGVVAGIKSSGNRDVALVINDGPYSAAAGVFTSNRVKAAPVLWSEQVLKTQHVKAVILNSGGANACTGPEGFGDTHRTAEHVAAALGLAPIDIAVCSTGLIGQRLPMDKILAGADAAVATLAADGGADAALAIMTTDSVSKTAVVESAGWSVGGMAKGAGMLAPGLATMLVVITTDADVSDIEIQAALVRAVEVSFNRIDSDGCMSTNDTVLLLSSGASGIKVTQDDFVLALTEVCSSLARQLIADAEGASKDIRIDVLNAATEADAVDAARAVSRSNLLKCAIHGEDPNWGRVLSAVGTTAAAFDPNEINVALNGVWVCRKGMTGDDRNLVDMKAREVTITIDLQAGGESATLWTNDLTAMYVHENSAYSS
ncbi:MAG: putative glutamate N-acetyltransferase/amino-acid acetyltransferase [Actinomycetota bacterium]